jgi:hypothetical protein
LLPQGNDRHEPAVTADPAFFDFSVHKLSPGLAFDPLIDRSQASQEKWRGGEEWEDHQPEHRIKTKMFYQQTRDASERSRIRASKSNNSLE